MSNGRAFSLQVGPTVRTLNVENLWQGRLTADSCQLTASIPENEKGAGSLGTDLSENGITQPDINTTKWTRPSRRGLHGGAIEKAFPPTVYSAASSRRAPPPKGRPIPIRSDSPTTKSAICPLSKDWTPTKCKPTHHLLEIPLTDIGEPNWARISDLVDCDVVQQIHRPCKGRRS